MSGWILSIGNLLIPSHVKAMLGILKTIRLIDVTMIIDWDYELLTFNPGTHYIMYTSGNQWCGECGAKIRASVNNS